MKRLTLVAGFLILVAAASANYTLEPATIDGGGGPSNSAQYLLRASMEQTASGVASSPQYILAAGFQAMISNGGGATVLAEDAFDAPLGPAWSIATGAWSVNSGALEHAAGGVGPDSIRSTGPSTANAWIEAVVTVPAGTPQVSLVFRADSTTLDGANEYLAQLDYAAGSVRLRKKVAGVPTIVSSSSMTLVAGIAYSLRVKFAGDDMRVLVDGVQKLCLTDSSILASGYYGLQVAGSSLVRFDDFRVATASNSVPVSLAGPDQALAGDQSVLLDGTGSSDGDGDPLNYTWSQTGGPLVTLSNATSAAPTFSGVAGNTYTFQLVVDDCLNAGAPDSVTVTVSAASPPTGNGGGGGGGGGCGLTGLESLIILALLRRRRQEEA